MHLCSMETRAPRGASVFFLCLRGFASCLYGLLKHFKNLKVVNLDIAGPQKHIFLTLTIMFFDLVDVTLLIC